MIVDYDVIFKLPCEKTFTFNISVSADDYDPTTEVGNHPSRLMLDYFLLYVPSLQDYSGDEISNGTVVSVCPKNTVDTETPSAKDEPEHKEDATPSLKSLYWKNGYIVKTRSNGYAIICNDMAFCSNVGSILRKSDLDESLIEKSCRSYDIIEVWDNVATCAFNPYSAEDLHRHCRLVWTRPIEMTREEIERKLNLRKGSLVIID